MSAPRTVVFNADDFALSDGVCEGIIESMERGVVRSTTAMVCPRGATARLARWRARVSGRCGVHLQATRGAPVLPARRIASLVDGRGQFREPSSLRSEPALVGDIVTEWSAQIATMRKVGVDPTHLDLHHHVFGLPGFGEAYLAVARMHGLPARPGNRRMVRALREVGLPCVDGLSLGYYGRDLGPRALARELRWAFLAIGNRGVLEVMCHPARVDRGLLQRSSYTDERALELETLCSPDLAEWLRTQGISLGHYLGRGAPDR